MTTRCPHCKQDTLSGTHNGCSNCGRVKHKIDGLKNAPETRKGDK